MSNTTCKMLEKANDQDLEGLLAYTIRNLDCKIVTGSDISQYKLMNVKEAPIDNRQEHLDLLSFPTLFPTGQKDIFNIVIIQRYVKKEYQMREAPHFHILKWIENAPVVGINCPEEVCSFIQDRITCHT